MSGGFFDYDQYKVRYIAEAIEQLIIKNRKHKRKNDRYSWEEEGILYSDYEPEIIEKFKEAVVALMLAERYAHRIDWMESGDDSEESFLIRLQGDLQEVRAKYTEEYFEKLINMPIEKYFED